MQVFDRNLMTYPGLQSGVSNSAPYLSYPFPPEVARDGRGIAVFILPLSGERCLKDNKGALYFFSQYVYPRAELRGILLIKKRFIGEFIGKNLNNCLV
jgi:hypothetical protein